MLINQRELIIEFGDCDPGGIVYFPRYFEFVDACTNALFELAGLPQPRMQKMYGIAGIPVVEAKAQFFVPSQFGDRVRVESAVAEWGRSSFSVRHRVLKSEVLAAELIEKRVWVMRVSDDPVRFKAKSIPWEVKGKFSDLPEKK
ncbi:MAG: acyl-CoA thioesterase [Candidatus Acidiferrales bacterium]